MDAKTFRDRTPANWLRQVNCARCLIAALVIFAVRSSFADWNDVPTGSMKPTILEGDRVFVNKLAYDLKSPVHHAAHCRSGVRCPNRGDIVVFYSPKDGTRLVKRTVGLPGDVIELRHDQLIINGSVVDYKPIAEELLHDLAPEDRASSAYASEKLPGRSHLVAGIPALSAMRDFGPLRVPEWFLLHDGRQPRQQLRLALFRRRHAQPDSWSRDDCGRLVGSQPLLQAALGPVLHFVGS